MTAPDPKSAMPQDQILIQGNRFFVRRIEVGDAALIHGWMQKPKFARIRPVLKHLCPTVEALAARISAFSALKPPLEVEGLVVHQPTNSPIGLVELTNIDWLNSKAEFSLGIIRGHGTRCLAEVFITSLDTIFNSLKLRKIIFYIAADNSNVLRLIQRSGLYQEGILRQEIKADNGGWQDLHRFSLFEQEWRQSPLKQRLQKILRFS